MLSRYHLEITKSSLESFFSPTSLREIMHANVRQDSFVSLFGVEGRRHVCDCAIQESLHYVDEEHAQVAKHALSPGQEGRQRAALGRLLHTVQDFYAHTNYVALWVVEKGNSTWRELTLPDVLDQGILTRSELRAAQWQVWREPLYYVPVLGNLLRRLWLPAMSHEAVHLDSPDRGAKFHLAVRMARQRTLAEYARAVAAIRQVGGQEAVERFHGAPGHLSPRLTPESSQSHSTNQ